MAKLLKQESTTITMSNGEVLDKHDDRVLCTDNIYTHENVMRIMSENNICPDVHQADCIIAQLPKYYTTEDVVRIDASL